MKVLNKLTFLSLFLIILLFSFVIATPTIGLSEAIDVQIKGVDDGVKTNKQRDYKEAVLFAKREAIERAGVKVKALTTAKDFVIHSDYIESKAEAALLPGYDVIDVGYQKDGTYLVILIGKVKTSTPDPDTKEASRDGSFVKFVNGVVYDESTKLEWYVGPDEDTTWDQAKAWAEGLSVADGGWRMPTRKELKTLYQKGAGKRNMTPLLKTTGLYVWSGEILEIRGYSYAWFFSFKHGNEGWTNLYDTSGTKLGFAVRSRK